MKMPVMKHSQRDVINRLPPIMLMSPIEIDHEMATGKKVGFDLNTSPRRHRDLDSGMASRHDPQRKSSSRPVSVKKSSRLSSALKGSRKSSSPQKSDKSSSSKPFTRRLSVKIRDRDYLVERDHKLALMALQEKFRTTVCSDDENENNKQRQYWSESEDEST